MFRPVLTALALATLLWVGPALAASGLEALRSEASSARAKVSEVRSRQMGLRQELNRLAGRIETLKREGGRLRVGGELDASLKRSQEISGVLGSLARELQELESVSQERNVALVKGVNAELELLRQKLLSSEDRHERTRLAERMRQLRQERESLRAALPAESQLAGIDALTRSDDPEDLLEQADALRDSEDKVRQKMRALESRISEVKQERELDRRMHEFVTDEALFDEGDRRLRLRRPARQEAAAAAADDAKESPGAFGGGSESAGPAPAAVGDAAPAPGDSAQLAPSAPGTATLSEPAPSAPAPEAGRQAPPADTGSSGGGGTVSKTTESPTLRTQVGSTARGIDGRAFPLEAVDLESSDLKALKSELERLKKAASSYGQKARELEEKARTLESPR